MEIRDGGAPIGIPAGGIAKISAPFANFSAPIGKLPVSLGEGNALLGQGGVRHAELAPQPTERGVRLGFVLSVAVGLLPFRGNMIHRLDGARRLRQQQRIPPMPTPKMNPEEQRAYDEALRRIEAWRREGKQGAHLELSDLGLTALPPEIGQLTALTELNLYGNQLTSLPPAIGQLTALRGLSLHGNQFTALPPAIGQLTALTGLFLDGNQLTSLPPAIGQLTALRGLSLRGNQLTALPPEIGQLTSLIRLVLDGNQLTSLPPVIGQLTALTGLFLDGNQLTALPPEIGRLVQLELLIVQNNALRELPESLKGLPRLKELTLHGNDGLGLPTEVLGPVWLQSGEKNPPAKPGDILDYYFAQREGPRRALNEVKVLVVGESEVGKTSLIRQLRGERHDPRQDKTHGIERHRLPMRCGRLGEVRLNVWDFGGQDIMHATHQFFLTHRSVYLLVLDSRQNERQSRIDYWLRLIASYGGDSPVIVVCNKADQQVMQLNWTGLQREYPQIKAYAKEVSCYQHGVEDRRKGLEELKAQIAQAVEQEVAEVDRPILERWLDFKDALEKDGRPYLTLAEYHAEGARRGITAQRDREILLTLMHQLGSVLHFSEHAIFDRDRKTNAAPAHVEELNVLDPGWVTGAIYKLLNDAELMRAGGTMTRGDMRRSLAELPEGRERYPRDKEDFIIAMMRRFEICFAFDGESDGWFLPDLLHKDEVDSGDWKEALGFRHQYRVLPGSVIGRLMVRLHGHIARHCLWRTGAKFKDGACEALVRTEPEDARLDILVRGGTGRERREFLALIRGTLAGIHSSFSDKLGEKELVPVPGHPGVFVGYQKLLLLEEKGTTLDAEEVDGRLVEVDVAAALNGVTERESRDEERLRLSRKEEKARPEPMRTTRTPALATHGVWWKSWPMVSLGTGLAAGAVALVLMEWESTQGRIIIAISAAVFGLMMSHNPALRFRRLFQWALVGWMAANALGIAIAAKWTDANGEAMLKWDGSVGWSFNGVFAVVVLVTGFLAYKEWEKETPAA